VTLPLAAGTAAAAGPIIRFFYGEGYEESVAPLQVMAAIIVLNTLDQVYWRVLAARNEQRKDLLVRIIGAGYRIGVGAALIATFGIAGAAWSALTSVALVVVLLAFYVQRDGTPLRVPALAGRSLLASGGMAVLVWMLSGRLSIIPLVAVGVIAYTGLVWVLRILNDEDKRLIASIVNNRRGGHGSAVAKGKKSWLSR
jgi:O-antigen/teichoic acid export membrane protein